MIPPAATVVSDSRDIIVLGKQLLDRLVLKPIGLDGSVQIVGVRVMVLGVVYLHRQRVDVGLKRSVLVWHIGQLKGHCYAQLIQSYESSQCLKCILGNLD
jgi:hypothetical protein